MDYPDRWKKKLPTEEERKELGEQHWRPTWWQMLLLLATIVIAAVVFWPGGCAAGG